MPVPPAKNKTEKYSGLVKNVQGTNKPPEEPKITKEQVIEAFQSFGFTPNDRNHNDIAFWTTKGQSETPRMIEELSKKRKEINQREDDTIKADEIRRKSHQDILNKHEESKAKIISRQDEAKIAMPRLSDEDIAALFDEYGLPKPDPEWARNHMPNDPKKIRSLLEMQRKMADDMFKKHSKNAVNSLPETPKSSSFASPQALATPMMGQGGPSPMGMQGDMTQDGTPQTPFFIGDHSIVRLVNPRNPNASTTWLVDVKKKILRPFASEQAFKNAFESPEDAEKAVIMVTSKDFAPGGPLEGFTPLKGDKAVKDDGSMDDIEFTPAQLQNKYGKQPDPQSEQKAMSMLDSIFGKMSNPQQ